MPRLLDVSVPLSTAVPASPGNPAFELHAVKRIAAGVSIIDEMYCLPLRIAGADGAPARAS
ncbi:MAG: hypothetical protein WBC51_26760 [Vicinamibacterales bacterium]